MGRRYPSSYWNQYCVLQGRALQAYTRNPANVAGRTLMAIFIGIIGGIVFLKTPAGPQSTPSQALLHVLQLLAVTSS